MQLGIPLLLHLDLDLDAAASKLMSAAAVMDMPMLSRRNFSCTSPVRILFDRNSYHPRWWAPRHTSSKHLPGNNHGIMRLEQTTGTTPCKQHEHKLNHSKANLPYQALEPYSIDPCG